MRGCRRTPIRRNRAKFACYLHRGRAAPRGSGFEHTEGLAAGTARKASIANDLDTGIFTRVPFAQISQSLHQGAVCKGLRENDARVHAWKSFVYPCQNELLPTRGLK